MDDPGPVACLPACPPARLPSYPLLCRRLRRLQLTPDILRGLRTYGQLQRRCREQYYALARRYHPDYRAQHTGKGTGRPLTGDMFRRIAKTYAWLRALPPAAPLPTPQRRQTPPTAPSVPVYDLPWALCRRPVALDWGWQEIRLFG